MVDLPRPTATEEGTLGHARAGFQRGFCTTLLTLVALALTAGPAAACVASRSTITTAATKAPPNTGATGYRTLVRPPFKTLRRVVAKTPGQFKAALANLRAGDNLVVRRMKIPGEVIINKALSAPAEIHLNQGVHFTGTPAGSGLPAVWIVNAQYIRIFGGNITNPNGTNAILLYDSHRILWWGFRAHKAGATCFSVFNVHSGSSHLNFDGTISNCGLNPNYDPHLEQGTGQHGAYLGGGNTAYSVSHSRFSLYVHDQAVGAAVQAGSQLSSDHFWVKAVNITFKAKIQVAGNAIQFWGGALRDLTVNKVTGTNLAGRVVETGGMYPTGNAHIVVLVGRGHNTLLNPRLSRVNFLPNPAVRYVNVRPLR